ncbi:MAG: HEAT repeat domain-containing protein [Candidatus Micrarchaeota archaeon]
MAPRERMTNSQVISKLAEFTSGHVEPLRRKVRANPGEYVGEIRQIAENGSESQKINLIKRLAGISHPKLNDVFIDLLESRSPRVKAAAILASGLSKDPKAFPMLGHIILTHPLTSREIAKDVVESIGKVGHPVLTDVLSDGNNETAHWALDILEKRRAHADFIASGLDNEDSEIRERAAQILARRKSSDVVPHLKRASLDPTLRSIAYRRLYGRQKG